MHRRRSLIAAHIVRFTFIFSIPALLFYDPLLNHVDYIAGAGTDTRVAVGALFEIIVVILEHRHGGRPVPDPKTAKRGRLARLCGLAHCRINDHRRRDHQRHCRLNPEAGHCRCCRHGLWFTRARGSIACRDPRRDVPSRARFLRRLRHRAVVGLPDVHVGARATADGPAGPHLGRIAFATATAVLFGAYEQQSGINLLFTVPEILWSYPSLSGSSSKASSRPRSSRIIVPSLRNQLSETPHCCDRREPIWPRHQSGRLTCASATITAQGIRNIVDAVR